MNENKTPDHNNKKGGALSWVFIMAALYLVPPLGVFLLIAMLTGRDLPGKLFSAISRKAKSIDTPGSSTGGKYYSTYSSSQSRARNAAGPDQIRWEKVAQQEKQEKAEANNTDRHTSKKPEKPDDGVSHISRGKNMLFYCGWIVLALGIFGGISDIADSAGFWEICRSAAAVLGGAGMLFTAHNKDKKEQLYQNCVKIVGNQAFYELKALSEASGLKPKKLERELNEMLERHYFPEGAYIDKARGMLILNRGEAEKRASDMENASQPNREQDKYDLLLQELERACGRISDREMMEKSVQIRGLTAAIFHAVRQEPEKESQISSFLNYYFPTTLKLMDSYADIESKGYQGEKLSHTGERIKSTADTLISAYQKQLDNLYLHDAMDVDSDIDVLETMLKRDGLSESDFKTKGTPGTGS